MPSTEVSSVLHADRDPALFALWGSFVPPHHQVRSTPVPRWHALACMQRFRVSHAVRCASLCIRLACISSRRSTRRKRHLPRSVSSQLRCWSSPGFAVNEMSMPMRQLASCSGSAEVCAKACFVPGTPGAWYRRVASHATDAAGRSAASHHDGLDSRPVSHAPGTACAVEPLFGA